MFKDKLFMPVSHVTWMMASQLVCALHVVMPAMKTMNFLSYIAKGKLQLIRFEKKTSSFTIVHTTERIFLSPQKWQ